MLSATGSPSKRSTARRFAPPRRTKATSASSAGPTTPVRVAKRDERTSATLHEERRLAAQEDDVSARHPCGARPRPLRPRKRGAVRLGRVGRCEHERLRLLRVTGAKLAESLDRTPERELRTAQTFDEVAPPTGSEGLERPELTVDGAEAAGDPLPPDPVSRDDPLPLEQELGQRTPVGLAVCEEPRRKRPAALRRRRRSPVA